MLGPAQLPRPEDVHALPYTNAVLHEVQRFITLLPHAPRCTVADTQLGPYLLPKVRGPGPRRPRPSPSPLGRGRWGLGRRLRDTDAEQGFPCSPSAESGWPLTWRPRRAHPCWPC